MVLIQNSFSENGHVDVKYRNLVIFRVENISYVINSCSSYTPHIIYETRVKVSLLKSIHAFIFCMDGSVRN